MKMILKNDNFLFGLFLFTVVLFLIGLVYLIGFVEPRKALKKANAILQSNHFVCDNGNSNEVFLNGDFYLNEKREIVSKNGETYKASWCSLLSKRKNNI